MASPEKRDDKKRTSSRARKHSSLQKDSNPDGSASKRPEYCISRSQKVGPEKQTVQNKRHLTVTPPSKKADMANGTAKVSNKSTCKRKKALPKLRGSYSLRSLDSSRALRSNTPKCKTPMNQASNPENLVTRRKKRGKKKIKNSGQDELSRIKKHIRYMLKRMNYEQSLIDAYSGDGWKGQSAEKIRPEKELERAKSEILRCKLKIREIFQHLDSMLAEGRIQESLFDPDGIDSENIFCGKCGSEEVSSDNDIILCDGDCERGFHQKCLNPPLLSENVPTGDEGWLCPQCDCKVDCIDFLNEFRGTDLSIEDSWERIFPEAAALTNGNRQYDDLNLPSDDSEDDDYDPDVQGVNVDEQVDGSTYEESDSSSSSYGSTSSDDNANQVTVELPTDDSEDDDYDPNVADPDREIHKNKSSSDESDFTSDSDEFCAELGKTSYVDEDSASSLPSLDFFVDSGRDDRKLKDKHINSSEIPSAMLEVDQQESGLRSSHKRDRERLDYKKLYDEAYGKLSSDSSDDEEWNEMSEPKKLKQIDDEGAEEVTTDSFAKTTQKFRKKFSSSADEKEHGPQEPHSSGYSFATVQRTSGVASKKLYEAFQENQYPTREMKESLAQELGMTFQQVTKWFGNVRHRESSNSEIATSEVSIQRENPTGHSQPDKVVGTKLPVASTPHKATDAIRTTSNENLDKKKLEAAFQENQYPSREKKEELAEELGVTLRKVSKWFENARRRSHVSAKKSSNQVTSSPDKAEASSRTPGNQFGIGVKEKKPGAFTPDRTAITRTTPTSNAKPDNKVDQILGLGSPRDKASAPKSCTSPHGIDLESPGVSIANGSASNKKRKKAAGATFPKGGSEGSRDGDKEEDDRQKAIAKELRRLRTGR